MNNILGLLLTFFTGMFILLGVGLVYILNDREQVLNFSLSAAIGVVISLIAIELLPESINLVSEGYNPIKTILIVAGFVFFGIIILQIIHKFIPHHHCDEHGCHDSLIHISIISSIGIILHNIIEGMVVYSSSINSFSLGVMLSIGVGLHNIPIGMLLGTILKTSKKQSLTSIFIISIITLSTFFGGIIMCFIPALFINEIFLGIILSVTSGMLIYIVMFELIPEVKQIRNNNSSLIGITAGFVLILISLLFH